MKYYYKERKAKESVDNRRHFYLEKVADHLNGGSGFDTYLVSHQDVINDADGDRMVMFNDKKLGGKKTKLDETTYEGYFVDGGNLIVAFNSLYYRPTEWGKVG
ncbi:hypothetical protein [Hydrogenimonas sp.]